MDKLCTAPLGKLGEYLIEIWTLVSSRGGCRSMFYEQGLSHKSDSKYLLSDGLVIHQLEQVMMSRGSRSTEDTARWYLQWSEALVFNTLGFLTDIDVLDS